MSQPAVATCANHPQREAIGVCVQCRTRVCSECSTKVEGINYCVTCLAGLALAGGRRTSVRRSLDRQRLSYLSAAAYFVTLACGLWLMLEALLPGAG